MYFSWDDQECSHHTETFLTPAPFSSNSDKKSVDIEDISPEISCFWSLQPLKFDYSEQIHITGTPKQMYSNDRTEEAV